MEFNVKLQELRKQKGITQDELAEALYVSRAAVSKWESGRGYPNIDSLKALSEFFGVSIDELLSGNEILSIAQEDTKQKENRIRDLVFGALDVCFLMILFLPFFRQQENEIIEGRSLLLLNDIAPYLKILYFAIIISVFILGIITLALQALESSFWLRYKRKISIIINLVALGLFVISLQPYAAIFVLMIFIIKVLMLIKWQ